MTLKHEQYLTELAVIHGEMFADFVKATSVTKSCIAVLLEGSSLPKEILVIVAASLAQSIAIYGAMALADTDLSMDRALAAAEELDKLCQQDGRELIAKDEGTHGQVGHA